MAITINRNGLPESSDLQRHPKKRRRRSSDLRRLSHEFINQLTVINLSCFRIRAIATMESSPTVLAELERIEKTVAEVTEMLANLPAEDDATPVAAQSGLGQGKVYPLFKSNLPER
jgi:hypothetical protein